LLKIKRQPQALTVEKDETALFAVELEGQAQGPVAFTWKRNGSPLSAASSPFLERSGVKAADAGYYSVHVTDGATSLESDVALLRVTPAQRNQWGLGRLALLVLAAASLALAGYIWIEPTTSCTVTTERSGSSSSTKTTQRTVKKTSGQAQPGTSSSERTRERVREVKAAKATRGAASADGCTIPGVAASTVTVVESRDPADSKEFVIVLVGLAAALGLVAAFYSRISKVSFPGGSVELRDLAQKTTQAVGDASTSLDALSAALAGVKSTIERVQVDLDVESRRRSLSVEKLELELAQLAAQRPSRLRRKPAGGDNVADR